MKALAEARLLGLRHVNLIVRLDDQVSPLVAFQENGVKIDVVDFRLGLFHQVITADFDLGRRAVGGDAARPPEQVHHCLGTLIGNRSLQPGDLAKEVDLLTAVFLHRDLDLSFGPLNQRGYPSGDLVGGQAFDSQPAKTRQVDTTVGFDRPAERLRPSRDGDR